MKLELEELSGKIIGYAIEVHRELGPGFLESIYEAALVIALHQAGLRVEAQKIVPVRFRQQQVGEHRLDLLVEASLIVELKAIKALEDVHFATVRSYLKSCRLRHGLLLNFSTVPLTVKRVIYDPDGGGANRDKRRTCFILRKAGRQEIRWDSGNCNKSARDNWARSQEPTLLHS